MVKCSSEKVGSQNQWNFKKQSVGQAPYLITFSFCNLVLREKDHHTVKFRSKILTFDPSG